MTFDDGRPASPPPPPAPSNSEAPLHLMDFLGFLVTQCLNALSQAALLFFLGVGLTLIFGIMRIVNFAHGAFFMLGAYVGYSAVHLTGSFWAALIAAPLLVGGLRSRLRTRHPARVSTGATTAPS